jgi:hypothetical protein
MEGTMQNISFFSRLSFTAVTIPFLDASIWLMTPALCYHDSPQLLQMAIDGNDFYVLIPSSSMR